MTTGKDLRRSIRITLSIPIIVSGHDIKGEEIHENTSTILVNKHGGLFSSQHLFSVDAYVVLSVPHTMKQQKCRVSWIGRSTLEGSNHEVAVELERAENFWGVRFPPEDWNIPRPLLQAGDTPNASLPQKDLNDYELQRLSSVVKAMLALLEEKGLLTRSELAERLKQTD